MRSMKEFRQFLNDIEKCPRLSPKRELYLLPLAQRGNQEALDELVLANMRIVLLIARRYVRKSGIPIEDIVSHGSVGLLKAIQRFDVSFSDGLRSYARFWIEKEIRVAISDQGHPVRIPVKQGSRIAKMYREANNIRSRMNREPTTEEVEKALGLSRKAYDTMRWVSTPQISIHEAKPSGYTFEDELHEDAPTMEEVIIEMERNSKLERAISRLSKREEELIRLSSGFESPGGMTLQEIAKKLKITRDRASDIQEMALCRLRMEVQREGLENMHG